MWVGLIDRQFEIKQYFIEKLPDKKCSNGININVPPAPAAQQDISRIE